MERLIAVIPLLPVVALVFHAGSQAERLSDVIQTTHMLEIEQKGSRDLLYEIHGKLSSVENDIKHLEKLILNSK